MTAAQLALFSAPLDSGDEEPLRPDFWSHSNPDRSGIAAFVIAIWGKGDPERSPRDGSDMSALWRKAVKAQSVDEHEVIILEHLSDGVERTFNRICIELYDKNAVHMLDLPPELALWALNDKALVEHTNNAPILWRKKGKAA